MAAMAGWGATASKNEKPAMPDDLRYEFKSVPANENAIICWRQAAAIKAPLNDREKSSIKFCWTPEARPPVSDDLIALKTWLQRNNEALRLFKESVARPNAQWPERNPQNLQPEMLVFSEMVRARLLEAELLAEAGNFDAAAAALKETLKTTQIGINGDARVLHYMVACAGRTLTQNAILRLAGNPKISISTLEDLLRNLPGLDSETNVFIKVLKTEFVSESEASIDMQRLSQDWSKLAVTNSALSLFPEECIRPFKVLVDPALTTLHPKPYDAVADIQVLAGHYRIYITNSIAPWAERCGQVELDREMCQSNLLAEIEPLLRLVENEPLPLSRRAAQIAKAEYLKIENPVGRIFSCSLLGFVSSDIKVFRVRTEREVTRTIMALLIFERRKGRLPADLTDLVGEKILNSIPTDPFSGEPLHYSRERRIVWSVGDDGDDDNGQGGKSHWYEDDAVWHIPKLN